LEQKNELIETFFGTVTQARSADEILARDTVRREERSVLCQCANVGRAEMNATMFRHAFSATRLYLNTWT
jgi:hypothetical protein